MKTKIILFILLAVNCLYSCENSEDVVLSGNENELLKEDIEQLDRVYEEAFSNINKNLANYVYSDSAVIAVNISDLAITAVSELKSYSNSRVVPMESKFTRTAIKHMDLSMSEKQKRLGTLKGAEFAHFSDTEKVYLRKIINDITYAEDEPDLYHLTKEFDHDVAESELTKMEKMRLLNVSSGIRALHKYLENGGASEIYANFHTSIMYTNARLRCKVNTRDVAIGAVYGLTTGAIAGGYTGATAGTVYPYGE